MKTGIFYTVILLAVLIPVAASGTEPMEALKAPIEKTIEILEDPRYQGAEQEDIQREKLWNVIYPVFDFTFISKSVLGRFHWNNTFSPAQQEKFIDVFSRFLGNKYLDKIQEGYEGQNVVFVSGEILSPGRAIVKTEIPQENTSIPIDYRMRRIAGKWKIYDVLVENVSLIENYRSQIRSILINKSADELIDQLQSKLNESENDQ
ncbi:MAG: ABC transporter substrate-binding protein [Desulfobacterales bacterium]